MIGNNYFDDVIWNPEIYYGGENYFERQTYNKRNVLRTVAALNA